MDSAFATSVEPKDEISVTDLQVTTSQSTVSDWFTEISSNWIADTTNTLSSLSTIPTPYEEINTDLVTSQYKTGMPSTSSDVRASTPPLLRPLQHINVVLFQPARDDFSLMLRIIEKRLLAFFILVGPLGLPYAAALHPNGFGGVEWRAFFCRRAEEALSRSKRSIPRL
uniref:Uncharacterized protein n=1 Tax=Ditylenchus dipsaci TaxID=166011 RepID=A0A915E279_9BILA